MVFCRLLCILIWEGLFIVVWVGSVRKCIKSVFYLCNTFNTQLPITSDDIELECPLPSSLDTYDGFFCPMLLGWVEA